MTLEERVADLEKRVAELEAKQAQRKEMTLTIDGDRLAKALSGCIQQKEVKVTVGPDGWVKREIVD